MTVGYAVTFEHEDQAPVTHRGTLTEDQSLALVALLLDPALLVDGSEPVSETSETSRPQDDEVARRGTSEMSTASATAGAELGDL